MSGAVADIRLTHERDGRWRFTVHVPGRSAPIGSGVADSRAAAVRAACAAMDDWQQSGGQRRVADGE
jgi:hypothetical protein